MGRLLGRKSGIQYNISRSQRAGPGSDGLPDYKLFFLDLSVPELDSSITATPRAYQVLKISKLHISQPLKTTHSSDYL